MKKLFLFLVICFPIIIFSQENKQAFDENYKKGMEYYENGTDLKSIFDPTAPANSVPTEAIEEFKKALPYLEKARDINSKDKNVLAALQEIYFDLHELKKSDKCKKELEALNKK